MAQRAKKVNVEQPDETKLKATVTGTLDLTYSDTVSIYNVTMTSADTEYSQALPANCRKFLIHTKDETEFRLAFETGKVAAPTAPYFTIPASKAYYEDFVKTSVTLYFASAEAGKEIEIIAWS